MRKDIEQHAKVIAQWLKEEKNPHTTVEITDQGVKVKSDEESVPLVDVTYFIRGYGAEGVTAIYPDAINESSVELPSIHDERYTNSDSLTEKIKSVLDEYVRRDGSLKISQGFDGK